MDRKSRQVKLKMWRDTLKQLEKELEVTTAKKGQAAQEGNPVDNIAYTVASEETETTKARIEEVKKIIKELEGK